MGFYLSFSVVFPLCAYICVGFLARRLNLLDAATVAKMNSMVFKLLFPLMMFANMQSAASVIHSEEVSVVWLSVGIALTGFFLLCMIVPRFIKAPERRGTFIQGCFRGNGMLFAIPIFSALCGSNNVGIATVCLAAIVPCYNILSVVILKVSAGKKLGTKALIIDILKNPLIIGTLIGAFVVIFGIEIPDVMQTPISTLSSMVSPLALVLLGSGLEFHHLKRDIPHLLAVNFIKLILFPFFSTLVTYLIGYRGVPLISVFVFNCVPTAVGSYTMAREMGSDGDFAGKVVATSTFISLFTIFFWIWLLSEIGLIPN